MNSVTFIREANALIADIKDFKDRLLSEDEEQTQGAALQKRTNQLFSALQNPSLICAGELLEVARSAGIEVRLRGELAHQIAFFNN